MISHQKKFIFIHLGRTGGSSFERLAGVNITNDPRTIDAGNTDFAEKHATFSEYSERYPDVFTNYFKFTIVRNPYERLVSAWYWRNNVVGDFHGTLADFAMAQNEDWTMTARLKLNHVSLDESLKSLDFIARYENYLDDLKFICKRTGYDLSELPLTNKTSHKRYTKYYDDETLDLVNTRFKKDIDSFGYQFGD